MFIDHKNAAHAAIEQRYACAHTTRELRRRTIADGRTSYVRQCVDCGHTSNPVKATTARAECAAPPPYDDWLEARRRAAKNAEYDRMFLELRPILAREYREYLASPEWRTVRSKAIARAGRNCEICDSVATQVHHLSYKNLGNESLADLMALCGGCHQAVHRLMDRKAV